MQIKFNGPAKRWIEALPVGNGPLGAVIFGDELDFVIETPAGTPFAGKLVTAPSHSPENTFFTDKGETAWISVAAAMDTQVIEQLFRNCLAVLKELGLEEKQSELRIRIEASIKRPWSFPKARPLAARIAER